MNRTTSRLLLLLFTSTILASCISTHATVNTQIPSVAVSLSPTQDSKNQYDQFLIWHHDNSSFGIPLSIRNGSSGDYWFLYEKALIHFHNNEYSETISFDMLEPSIGIANGSIAVREDNSVWVGFPLGVLVVQTKDHFSLSSPRHRNLVSALRQYGERSTEGRSPQYGLAAVTEFRWRSLISGGRGNQACRKLNESDRSKYR